MMNVDELRLGNYVLYKAAVRILPVSLTLEHMSLLAKGAANNMFAIGLKPDILLKCGFAENKQHYQLPEVREFILTLPVKGNHQHEVRAYVAKESFARVVVNDVIASNHFYFMHQLQNVYYALTGTELAVVL